MEFDEVEENLEQMQKHVRRLTSGDEVQILGRLIDIVITMQREIEDLQGQVDDLEFDIRG